tara:strand:+ start:9249 stop:9515 length:267 start_codon:yes stop_codon:yes gene_type:complete
VSENIELPSITINNSSDGNKSAFDRIFDIGFKILIPALLVGALILIYIVVKLVLPFISGVIDIFSQDTINPFLIFGPLGGILSFVFGR